MPTFYYVVAYYKDGSHEVFEGHIRDFDKLKARLGSDPEIIRWTVDWDS